jgi:predicted PurR-regulated permease PerM
MLVAGNLWDFMWSLVVIFFMITYFLILFHIIVDIFRRHDTSGAAKAIWLLFIFFLPLLGMLAYMITQGDSMGRRAVASAQQAQQQTDDYIRSVAGGSAAEIERAKGLLDSGAITQQEFEAIKAKALAS